MFEDELREIFQTHLTLGKIQMLKSGKHGAFREEIQCEAAHLTGLEVEGESFQERQAVKAFV